MAVSRAQVRRFARMKPEPGGGAALGDSDDEETSDESSDSDDGGQGRALALPTPQGGWSLSSVRAAPAGPPAPRAGAGWWPWAGEPGHAQDDAQHAPWPSAVATAVTLSAAVVVFVKPPGDKGRGGVTGGGGGGNGRRRVGRHAPSPASLFAEAAQGGLAWPAPPPAPAAAPAPARSRGAAEGCERARAGGAAPRRGRAAPGRRRVCARGRAVRAGGARACHGAPPNGPDPLCLRSCAGKCGPLCGLPTLLVFHLRPLAGERCWPPRMVGRGGAGGRVGCCPERCAVRGARCLRACSGDSRCPRAAPGANSIHCGFHQVDNRFALRARGDHRAAAARAWEGARAAGAAPGAAPAAARRV